MSSSPASSPRLLGPHATSASDNESQLMVSRIAGTLSRYFLAFADFFLPATGLSALAFAGLALGLPPAISPNRSFLIAGCFSVSALTNPVFGPTAIIHDSDSHQSHRLRASAPQSA